MKELREMGQWNVTHGDKHDLATCLELDGFGIVGAVIDTEGNNIITRRALAFTELLNALRAMAETHGMHGPCTRNNCRDCKAAYSRALALINQFQR